MRNSFVLFLNEKRLSRVSVEHGLLLKRFFSENRVFEEKSFLVFNSKT